MNEPTSLLKTEKKKNTDECYYLTKSIFFFFVILLSIRETMDQVSLGDFRMSVRMLLMTFDVTGFFQTFEINNS